MWRRAMLACAGLAAIVLGAGCRIVEDSFTYQFTGRLVDAESNDPLSRVPVAVEDTDFNPQLEGEDWIGLSRTGLRGEFTDECTTVPMWRHTRLLGFIPLSSSTPPKPPPLREAYLVVKRGDQWVKQKLIISGSQQPHATPGRRHVNLGDIKVARPAASTGPTDTQPTKR